MTQIHVIIRRINPALKIDLVQVGHLNDRQFEPLPFGVIADSPVAPYLKSSDISDSLYVNHSDISGLVGVCETLPDFCIEFFDNTIILMFNLNIDCDESPSEKEGERD